MKTTSPLFKTALLSLSLLTILTGAAIAPTLGSIAEAFPDASATSVQMILTLPSIFIMATAILTGRLAVRVSQRKLLFIGLVIYVVSGVSGGFAQTITFLLVSRAVLGIGVGIITPLATSLITEFYHGEERARMVGYAASARSLTGVLVAPLIGIIAADNWRNIFWVYGLGFVIFLITLFLIPEPDKPTPVPAAESDRRAGRVSLPPVVWLFALFMVLQRVGFYVMPANLSLHLREQALGGSELAGWAISVDTLASFLIGLGFARLLKQFSRWLGLLALGVMGLGLAALALAEGIPLLMTAMALIGFGEGILMPLLLLQTAQAVPAEIRTLAIALVSSMQFLAQFITPYVFAGLGALAGDSSTRTLFWISAAALAAAVVVGMVINLQKQHNIPAAI